MSEQHQFFAEEFNSACKELMKYFTSGNSVPVERATIATNSKEIQTIKKLILEYEDA